MRFKVLDLGLAVLLVGCSGASNNGMDLEVRVSELVSQMTLEEKVAQMSGTTSLQGIYGIELWNVPGVDRLGVPPFKMSDGPRGVGVGEGRTAFPVAMARAASWNPELERRVGEAMGRELAAIGGNVLLAPAMNNLRHPSWGRSQETYGEDVHLLSRMGVAAVQGIQTYVLANPKHFAANSIEETRFTVNVTIDERSLREIYLPHFRAAVLEGGAASIMSAYNSVNGQFCGENITLLRRILKEEWGFDGFVLSDFVFGTHPDSARNGLDLEMPFAIMFGTLLEEVQSGRLSEDVIDEAVTRMVRKKLEHGLDQPSEVDERVIESEAHLAVARDAAVEGAVLLKNENRALPLDVGSLERIAVVGALADEPNIGDTGSSSVRPSFVVTPLEGLRDALGNDVAIDHIDKDTLDLADLDLVAAADAVVIVTGLTSDEEGEGVIGAGDRVDLDLPQEREQLIVDAAAANDHAIVVLEGGGAITMGEWLPDPDAVLLVWYPGQMGGHAIADLLLGGANPSGKLPITFPTGLEQLPPFDNVSDEVTYGYFHGYRYLDLNGDVPQFPFGFGLSYTTFALANLRSSQSTARPGEWVAFSVDVTNTGNRTGAEVIQLYVSYPESAVERAERELKAFQKIELEPGQTQTVTLDLAVDDLRYYDPESSAWLLEELEYVIRVGSSSRELPLTSSLAVESTERDE
jgi:beta-glucosidase